MIELFNLSDEPDFIDGPVDVILPPAADPWVKIEPGCEMPESEGLYLVIHCGPRVAHWDGELWWYLDDIIHPTHYAVLRMPEGR